jgi:hypothetical protein
MEEHVRPDILYDVTEELGREENEARDSLGVNDETADGNCRDFGDDEPAGDIPIELMPSVVTVSPDPTELDDQGCFVRNPV